MRRSIAVTLAGLLLLRSATVPTPDWRTEAYVWQRSWTPAVVAAVDRSEGLIGGWHVLAAEIEPQGTLGTVTPDWAAVMRAGVPVTAVLRADGRLDIAAEAALPRVIDAVVAAAPRIAGIEIDYDCPTAALPAYTAFLRQLRTRLPRHYAVQITALPTWLDASTFPALARAADALVLQVHAVADPRRGLFDPAQALEWARQMSRVSSARFTLALPAYQVRVGWDGDRLSSVVGEAPVFEAEDSRELGAAPAAVAQLIRDLSRDPPANLDGIAWFRLPTDADRRSWSFATWRAVIRGEDLRQQLVVQARDAAVPGTSDLVLVNQGSIDALLPRAVPIAADCRFADGAGGYVLDSDEAGAGRRGRSAGNAARRRRSMPVRVMLCLGLLLALASVAAACGPDFPWQVLADRKAVKKAAPANAFLFEVGRILQRKPAADHLPGPAYISDEELQRDAASNDPSTRALANAVTEARDIQPPNDATVYQAEYAYRRAAIERDGLNPAQIAALGAARAKSGAADAYAAAAGLAEPVRDYLAGAVAFAAGRPGDAAPYFQAAVDQPDKQRAVWAEFMLARCRAADDIPAAVAAYQKTRDLARQGAPDPLGLADASYGAEAKFSLDEAREAAKDLASSKYTVAISAALKLYAEGAVDGSDGNLDSLVVTLKAILASPATTRAAVGDTTARRLLVAFVAARADDLPGLEPDPPVTNSANQPAPRSSEYGINDRLPVPGAQIARQGETAALVDAIEAAGAPATEGADRLAALAYRAGRYDVAERAAKLAPGPISSWVLAKLALRDGDEQEAARRYAEAAAAFPAHLADLKFVAADPYERKSEPETADGALDSDNRALLEGERSIMALSRGEYVQALDLLYPAAPLYWGDVAYIAERVLTTDELKQFVDKNVPAVARVADGNFRDVRDESASKLRWLLARRLFRDRRYQDALPYFPQGESPDIVPIANRYATEMRTSEEWWLPTRRAEALFHAATLARTNGMELLGTEGPPDYRFYEGNFDNAPFGDLTGFYDQAGQTVTLRPSGEATTDETARVAASAGAPDKRFHYRYVAAGLAELAAASLPARSQAYAEIMCQAAAWTARDPAVAQSIYRRYLANGAVVPSVTQFGGVCPQPDFDHLGHARWSAVKHAVHKVFPRLRWAAAFGFFVLIAGLGGLGWALRRRRSGAEP
jgi:hypothetical protein